MFDLNAAIRELLDDLNNRAMRGWATSRRALFEQLDGPALQPLPAQPYEYAEWKRCRVNLDYHSLPRRRPGSRSASTTTACRTS